VADVGDRERNAAGLDGETAWKNSEWCRSSGMNAWLVENAKGSTISDSLLPDPAERGFARLLQTAGEFDHPFMFEDFRRLCLVEYSRRSTGAWSTTDTGLKCANAYGTARLLARYAGQLSFARFATDATRWTAMKNVEPFTQAHEQLAQRGGNFSIGRPHQYTSELAVHPVLLPP